MKRIVGLGNPGPRYEFTRHNVGWWVLDHLADVWRFPPWRAEGEALVTTGVIASAAGGAASVPGSASSTGPAATAALAPPGSAAAELAAPELGAAAVTVQLVKPQTFMNLSGRALTATIAEPGFDPRVDLLVVVDEAAIPVGRLRTRALGSHGGHNGLKDVERVVGHAHYARLRVGVGPREPGVVVHGLADYVLDEMPSEERALIAQLRPALEGACRTWATDGVLAAMNRFNGVVVTPPTRPENTSSAGPAAPPPPASPDRTG
ncbi:MAG: peptidyl-tRNA hydrolase [Gemmatimonadetes bacterium]|nr:peptidyl-tRNA hydrolase [Gemmatimonadota bacterium]